MSYFIVAVNRPCVNTGFDSSYTSVVTSLVSVSFFTHMHWSVTC